MSGVAAVRSPAGPQAPEPSGTSGTTLVPEGQPLSPGGIDDALGLLFTEMAQQRQNGILNGKSQVDSAEKKEQKALSDERAAQAAEEANQASHGRGFFSSIAHLLGDVTKDVTHVDPKGLIKDSTQDVRDAANSPAFWNDVEKGALIVAKVAAAVGSTVATAASLGAAGATIAGAAILLSVGCEVGGEVVSDTKCCGKDSGNIGLGLELAGVALGLAGGAVKAPDAMAVGLTFTAIGGAGETVAGAAHVKTSGFEANVQVAAADEQKAVNQNDELAQTTQFVIDDLKAADKSRQSGQQAVQGAIQGNDKTTVAAAAGLSLRG